MNSPPFGGYAFRKLVFRGEKNLPLLLQIIGQAAVSFPLKPTDTVPLLQRCYSINGK